MSSQKFPEYGATQTTSSHARHVRRPSLQSATCVSGTTERHTHTCDTSDAVCRCVPRNTRTRSHTRDVAQNPAISAAAHDFLHLPRKTMPSEATTRTIPHACHAKRRGRFSPRQPRESTFTTSPMATLLHICHLKRTRTNVQMQVFPATQIHPPVPLECGYASRVPCLPRKTHVRHSTPQIQFPHLVFDSCSLPRTRRRHMRTLAVHAAPQRERRSERSFRTDPNQYF